MHFGLLLAQYRRDRRMSQMDLSSASSVSQRHISFLESGRASPGAATVRRLSEALTLDFAAGNALFEAAGLNPPRPTLDWDDARFEPARRAIDALLARHEPFPAAVTLRNGHVLRTSAGFDDLLDWTFEGQDPWQRTGCRKEPNLYRLTLHPDGLTAFMQNPEDIIPHTLRRLRRAAAGDENAQRVLQACLRFRHLARYSAMSEIESAASASVMTERYVVRGRQLNFVSMVAAFGSPEDVTAQMIQIELFFPEAGAASVANVWPCGFERLRSRRNTQDKLRGGA